MLSLIIPVYNEAQNIESFLDKVVPIISRVSKNNYEIIFCNDPSEKDDTEKKIIDSISLNKNIKLITFSRRFGQSNSIFAGIQNCTGDKCIIMDVDLQDPPDLIEKLYNKSLDGYDCVYAKRKKKIGESFVRNIITNIFYFILNYFSYVKIPRNTGECRIISKKIINEIKQSNENHCFIRGITPLIGFKHSEVEFIRVAREIGESKYVIGSYKDAVNGIINFTNLLPNICLIFSGLNILFTLIRTIFYKFDLNFIYISSFFTIILLLLYFVFQYLIQINNITMNRKPYIINQKINF
jgi:dolichol-phosphate mannosyltransferase